MAWIKVYHARVRALERLPEVRQAVHFYATAMMLYCIEISPEWSGDYKRAFEIRRFGKGYRLFNRDFKAHWIEYGTAPHGTHPGTRAYHVMLRAAMRRYD